MTTPKWTPLYSGPNRTGLCKCGHSWEDHHLGCVANPAYFEATHEAYVPEECEYYGCNERGGMMPTNNGEWVDHCHRYVDSAVLAEVEDGGAYGI